MQNRCQDPLFEDLLDNIRHCTLTQNVTKALHGNSILYYDEPSNKDIYQVLKDIPHTLVSTESQNATN